MFFNECKIVVNSRKEYLEVVNHYTDILHGKSMFGIEDGKYPLYVIISSNMDLKITKDKSEYDASKIRAIPMESFRHMNYIVSHHFRNRFNDRFDNVSDQRFRKLLKNMIQKGTRLIRKDSVQALKYNKTSEYVLFSQYEKTEKVSYLIVLTNTNILTTIYEFNVKDMKYFKEI